MANVNARYVVLEVATKEDLESNVIGMIQDNWIPQGGVMIVALGEDDYLYAQAMTLCVGDNE